MKLDTCLLHSLDKIYPHTAVRSHGDAPVRCLSNEPYSFQLAVRAAEAGSCLLYIELETDLPRDAIAQYKIGYLPVLYAPAIGTPGYLDPEPTGLLPDPLYRRKTEREIRQIDFAGSPRRVEEGEKNLFTAVYGAWQGLWFTVNERGVRLPAGDYHLTVHLHNAHTGNRLASESIALSVGCAALPPQKLLYTSWLHQDCLCDTYGVEMFSPRHFEILRSFLREASLTGMNMILLPAFTPPLDTPVGGERMTAQLVGVEKCGEEYRFDFSLLIRFITLCREEGITHFEHSHFFTQWGAHHAPKIVGTVDGRQVRLFGWETDAASPAYLGFLRAYLSALQPVLCDLGIRDKILFHLSDEPQEKDAPHYAALYAALKEALSGLPCGDALSHYEVYRQSGVAVPIVSTNATDLPRFSDCAEKWLYYTGGCTQKGLPNRLMSNRPVQNRILGVFLYYHRAKGFLHWAYNFYYDVMCQGLHNPLGEPGSFEGAAGTYLVYPAPDGTAIPSARMKVQAEGFCDHRALCALEEKSGRAAVLSLIEKHLGADFAASPCRAEDLFALRQEVNCLLEEE